MQKYETRMGEDSFFLQCESGLIKLENLAKGIRLLIEEGMLTGGLISWISHFFIAPPLIITEDEIDEGIDIFDEVLKEADKKTD